MKHRILSITLFVVTGLFVTACQPAATEVPTVEATPTETFDTMIPIAEPMADRTPIYWFIGLGAGAQEDQIPQEQEWIEAYNNSQDEIQLIPIIVDNDFAREYLASAIAAGNAPDIVGPIGGEGRAYFPDLWLDLQPYQDEVGFDVNDIDPAFLDYYRYQGKLIGLPFAIFPSALFYNKDLFDQAGLNYPPHQVGDQYEMPVGSKVEWNFDTVAEIAKLMTLDAAGHNATSTEFDRAHIVQYGFDFQWTRDSPRWFSAYFDPYYLFHGTGAEFSDGQVDAIHWYYDAMWGEQPFLPTREAAESDLLNDNGFSSGKLAMGLTHLWYTCCIDPENVPHWDVAIVPSYKGQITAKMHGDTFGIVATTEHPDEAFKVYRYMLGDGASDLYKIYGGLPARRSQQQVFFASLQETYDPNKVDWQVFLDMIPYLDVPAHENALPNASKSQDALLAFGRDLSTEPNLDVDARIEALLNELNALWIETNYKN